MIESSHKSDIFFPKRTVFLYTCEICSELPSHITTMVDPGQPLQVVMDPSSDYVILYHTPLAPRVSSLLFPSFKCQKYIYVNENCQQE